MNLKVNILGNNGDKNLRGNNSKLNFNSANKQSKPVYSQNTSNLSQSEDADFDLRQDDTYTNTSANVTKDPLQKLKRNEEAFRIKKGIERDQVGIFNRLNVDRE